MKKIFISINLIFLISFNNVNAAQLNVNGSYDLYSNEEYSNNFSAPAIITNGNNSNLNLNGFNIITKDNDRGILVNSGNKLNINGSYKSQILINNNNTQGIVVWQPGSELVIKNSDIEISNTKGAASTDGINVSGGGNLHIHGNNNKLTIKGTEAINTLSGSGLYIGANSEAHINNMNIDIIDNNQGIYSNLGGKLYIKGDINKKNFLRVNNNDVYGIVASATGSEINIENMNIETNNNGLSGISSENGGVINIKGNGDNNMYALNNKVGIYVHNSSVVNVENMDIYIMNNVGNGITTMNSSQLFVDGDTIINNKLIINNNNGYGMIATVAGLGIRNSIILNNMDVEVNNNGRWGVVATLGSIIEMNGKLDNSNKLIVNDNGNSGIHSNATGSEIIINNMNIESIGNAQDGIYSQNDSSIKINGNGNSLVVRDNNRYGIDANINSSTIDINNMHIYASGNTVFRAAGGGVITLDNSSVNISDNSKLALFNDGVGNFFVTNSSLANQIFTDKSTGALSNVSLTDTIWRNIGKSNISNYIASNSDIYMSKYFGQGDTGDLLTIDNSSSGNTNLHIISTGDDKTQSEVLVVDQSSVSLGSANGSFVLSGGVVDSGAYEYELHKGDLSSNVANDNNYYLRSNGRMTGTAKLVSSMPSVHYSIINTGMSELRKRLGELRKNDFKKTNGTWARSYAKNMNVTDFTDSKLNLFGFEAGYDHELYFDGNNRVLGGIMAGYLYTDNIRSKMSSSSAKGSGHAKTPSLGLYATWLNKDGWFMDGTIREFWSQMSASNTTSQGQIIKYDADRNFTTGSVEFGRHAIIKYNNNFSFFIEPKAEARYSYSGSKNFNSNIGSKVSYGKTQSVITRGAIMAGYHERLDNNIILSPYLELGIGYEWDGKTDVKYAGQSFESNLKGTTYDLILGFNSQVNRSLSLYSDITYENGNVYEAFGGNIGVRYNW